MNLAAAPGLSHYDYAVIGFYLLFMVSIGFLFRGMSRTTSDYFRCGGAMPWWLTGTSAWLALFSAWTFVGGASEVYRSGLKVLLLYYATIPAQVAVVLYTAVRFRRMRVITWMEAVRERFGPGSEQFYTWIKIPIELLKASIGLMSVSVFMAAVFHVPIHDVIFILGSVITLVAFAGGAFAVVASDFVQMVLVMTITLITAYLTLRRPEIGGLGGLARQVSAAHPAHLRWWLASRPVVIFAWGAAFTWTKFAELNSMEFSTMYLMPKSERDARRMGLIPLLGWVVGPLLWVVPPLAAAVLLPNLGAAYPGLANPSEAAFVAIAMRVMPAGLLGLLVCAMLGATLTNMDAALNKYVGVFVRSFYLRVVRPRASEVHLLRTGKLGTIAFGAIVMALAVLIDAHRHRDLFTLLNQTMVSLGIPLTIPLLLGLHFRRTPGWSAWVTALAAFAFSAWANFGFARSMEDPFFVARLPEWAQVWVGHPAAALTATERNDLLLVVTALGSSVMGIVVFFGSGFFYSSASAEERERGAAFFGQLRRPLQMEEQPAQSDEPVCRLVGSLCVVFGGFILLLVLVPNRLSGRCCFLLIGAIMAGAGELLRRTARRKRAAA